MFNSRRMIGLVSVLCAMVIFYAAQAKASDTSRKGAHSTFMYCDTEDTTAALLFHLGALLERSGDLDSAHACYLLAIEADSGYCDAMDNLGRLCRARGNYDEAEYWYRRSLAILPDNDVAILNLATCFRIVHQLDSALIYFQMLNVLHPLDPEGNYGLGSCYLALGDYARAVDYLSKAEEVYREQNSPWIVDAWTQLAFGYLNLDSLNQSFRFATLTYQADSTSVIANYALGIYYTLSDNKNLDLAHRHFRVARDRGMPIPPGIVEVFPDLGDK